MKPQSCKSKGRRLQQRVVSSILDAFPHLTEDDVRSTSMGAPGEDVQLSTAARACVSLSLECKCVEKLNVWAALEQAERNAPVASTPCVVFSRNHARTYAALPWETVLALLTASHAAGGGGGRGNAAAASRVRELVAELATLV